MTSTRTDRLPSPRRAPEQTPEQAPQQTSEDLRALPAPVPLLPITAGSSPADAPGESTETARVALARARLRGVPVPDVVVFDAACPGCGRDAQWQEEREDTRLRVRVVCDC